VRNFPLGNNPDLASAFRLRLSVIDALSGKLVLAKEWGTRPRESYFQVTKKRVLLRIGPLLRLCFKDMTELRQLPLAHADPYEGWDPHIAKRRYGTCQPLRAARGSLAHRQGRVGHEDAHDRRCSILARYCLRASEWPARPLLYCCPASPLLLASMQITSYNFHLGLLRSGLCRVVNTEQSSRAVARPASLRLHSGPGHQKACRDRPTLRLAP